MVITRHHPDVLQFYLEASHRLKNILKQLKYLHNNRRKVRLQFEEFPQASFFCACTRFTVNVLSYSCLVIILTLVRCFDVHPIRLQAWQLLFHVTAKLFSTKLYTHETKHLSEVL